jgi:hypothetical protein
VSRTVLALAAAILLAWPVRSPAYAAPAAQSDQGPRVNADAKVMAEFETRVKEYSALHRKLEATLPDLPKEATPEQIHAHQVALAQLIARARSKAEFGDIFTKDTRALFRRYLMRVFAGPEGAGLKALIMDENPGKLRLHVNARYPESVPVTTVPPQVLQALPKLPEDLEYRFVGDRLVLYDIHAHTVVDVIEGAIRG